MKLFGPASPIRTSPKGEPVMFSNPERVSVPSPDAMVLRVAVIEACRRLEADEVGPVAADQLVVVFVAHDGVVVGAAIEAGEPADRALVVTGPADDRVVAGAARRRVAVVFTEDRVVAGATRDSVVALAAEQTRLFVSGGPVASALAVDLIVVVSALDRVVGLAPVDRVRAIEGLDQIRGAVAR